MRYFLDWARTKDVAYVTERGSEHFATAKDLILKFKEGDELYLESGFSNRLIQNFLVKGCKVFRADANLASEHRTNDKTSDIEDAKWLRDLYGEQPELFVEVEPLSEQERQLKMFYSMYRQVTRDIVRFKNIRHAMEWEVGKTAYEGAVKSLEQYKKWVFKQMKPLTADELLMVKGLGIKGIGEMLLAQLLAVAHPKDFASMSKYLAYCGCKARTFYKTFENGVGKGRGRFSRDAAQVSYLISESVIRQKDDRFYGFYLLVKKEFKEKHPDWKDGVCHGKAMNRLRTVLLKQIYKVIVASIK